MGERPISVSHPLFIIVQFNSTNCFKEINERLCHIKWLIYSCKTDILRKFYFKFWRVGTHGQIIYLRKTNDLCKRKLFYFFVHFFLLFSEKEERKRTKERRKNRCDHSLKIRSKSTSEFWEQVTAENAPASAFLVFC